MRTTCSKLLWTTSSDDSGDRSVTSSPWLDVDLEGLGWALNRSPFAVRHRLDHHPLLGRRALARLADDWPETWAEHHLADLPFVLPDGACEQLDLSVGEVVRDIDQNGCWVVLWFLERAAGYERVLEECLAPVESLVTRREDGMRRLGALALVSAPRTVVPAHFDTHHNFLLQIEGTKEVTIGRFADPAEQQQAVRRHFEDGNNNALRLPDEVQTFELCPGDGLYIPPYTFHWVRSGPQVSVSLSCGFVSGSSARTELVHSCNAKLRRLGLRPRPPGELAAVDHVKAAAVTTKRRLARLRRRHGATAGNARNS
jgi:hypothetical protein